jgi:hypothetical protein
MAKKPESGDIPEPVVAAPPTAPSQVLTEVIARLDKIDASLKSITETLNRTNGQSVSASPLPPPRMHHMAGTIRRKGDGF